MFNRESYEVRTLVVGPLETNCYAVIAPAKARGEKRPCVVVDPGANGAFIAKKLVDCDIRLIVATHGHADHISGVAELKEATGAPFAMHAADVERATHAAVWSSHDFEETRNAPEPDILLVEGQMLVVENIQFMVHEAPGHTPGGVVLLASPNTPCEGIAFVGDTIFAGSVGRTDLEGGDAKVLATTLKRLVEVIPDDTTLLCGHGPTTTMAQEKTSNPYIAPMV